MTQQPPRTSRPEAAACVLCGKCLEACPLLAATGREELSPRAKFVLAERGPAPSAEALARLCLGCGRCKAACPQGADIPALVVSLRAAHPDFRRWLWKACLARGGALQPMAAAFARLAPQDFLRQRLGSLLKGLRALPEPGCAPFLGITSLPEQWRGLRAALFAGCAGARLAPRWPDKARALLDRLGLVRAEAAFQCCGAPLGTAGLLPEQAAARAANVSAWRGAGRPLLAVFCSSCRAGLAAYPAECFQDQAEQEAWAAALTPLSRILHGARFVLTRNPGGLAWHCACHAPDPDPDLDLLRSAPGLELAVPEARCCGFGGVLQLAAPDLAADVAARRWDNLGAGLALTGCTACAMELAAAAPAGAAAAHWLDALETPTEET
jgi:glycolate oxidase iron-sulfur subunit